MVRGGQERAQWPHSALWLSASSLLRDVDYNTTKHPSIIRRHMLVCITKEDLTQYNINLFSSHGTVDSEDNPKTIHPKTIIFTTRFLVVECGFHLPGIPLLIAIVDLFNASMDFCFCLAPIIHRSVLFTLIWDGRVEDLWPMLKQACLPDKTKSWEVCVSAQCADWVVWKPSMQNKI